jgi:hypothetical protein
MIRPLLLLLLGAASTPWEGVVPCEAHLILTRQPQQILVASGVCRSYHYQLVAERWGRNSSRSSQGGTIELGAHQETQLAQTTVNLSPTDHFLLRLRVYDAAGHLVAQDSARQDP